VAEVEDDTGELPPNLVAFIDRLMVPLLVDRFINERHLYRVQPVYYDDHEGQAEYVERSGNAV
jgi:hypothetical protein